MISAVMLSTDWQPVMVAVTHQSAVAVTWGGGVSFHHRVWHDHAVHRTRDPKAEHGHNWPGTLRSERPDCGFVKPSNGVKLRAAPLQLLLLCGCPGDPVDLQ
jgi:hypothetical protein